jgi:hypothetical protein
MAIKQYIGCLLMGAGLLATGCKSSEPGSAANSKIVQEVQAAGSGQLDGADEASMQGWLNKHQDVAKKISGECGTATKAATAQWAGSTEGRLCAADAKVMFLVPKDLYHAY